MAAPLLETHELTAFYGDFQALYGISTVVAEGTTVAIIGANGSGKSTFLNSIAGLLRSPENSIRFDGADIGTMSAAEIVKLGIALVPEGRRLFPSLSVEENLLIGRYGRKIGGGWKLSDIYDLFPVLAERRHIPATRLSGGEQQMAAIGRSLMSNPRLLLCDEISLGLAPIVIKNIFSSLSEIRKHGTSLVVVEQDIVQAMAIADNVYCFQEGRMTLSGPPSKLSREAIHAAYFGL